jgi:hypothetical protein
MKNTLVKTDAVQDYRFTVDEKVEANTPYLANGFHGFVMNEAVSGEETIMDISSRTWQLNIGQLSLNEGDDIYIDTDNALTDDDTDHWFGKLVSDPDADGIADVWVAPQGETA